MIKSKFKGILIVLLLTTIIFIGCSNGGSDSAVINVTGVTLKAGEVTSGASIIYLGSTQAHLPASVTLTATVEPSNATNKAVTWTVEPDTYVTWNEAARTATAKALGGPTTITVKTVDGGFTETWTITVADPASYVAVTGVTITSAGPFEFVKPIGGVFTPASIQLEYEVTPANATDKGVSWSSSDEDVVTVSHTGLVTPVGNGTAEITLTSDDDITIIDQITVRVNDEAVEDVHVSSVEIVLASDNTPVSNLSFNKPVGGIFAPEYTHLSVVVLPANASNKTVEWSTSNAAVATVSENGVVTPVDAGDAVITATSNDNPAKTDSVNVKVTEEFAYSLKLVNLGTPTGTTTTTMPAIDHNNRYTISNAVSTAKFVSAGVTDATIVYLDYPAEKFSSISARVRIKKSNGGTATETGVIMGLMTNPAQPIATRGVNFAGMRVNTAGLWRPFTSRPNIATPSNNSSALLVHNTSGYGEINSNANSAIDNVAIPYDEEFIIEAERTGTRTNGTAGVYTTRLYSNGANIASSTLMASYSTANNEDIDISTTGKPAYLGFIIANCDVEISQIIVKETTDEIFSTPVSTPTPTPVASLEFTAPAVSSTATAGEYTCSHSIAGGNNTMEISAKVYPNRATDKTINWTHVSGPASLDTTTGNNVMVTFSGTGEVVVTASSGGKSIKLKITVSSGALMVESITISAAGGKTSIMAGNGSSIKSETLQFTETVNPDSATDPSVTWVISDDAVSTTGNTSGCTIDANGLLIAPNSLASDITIYVFAKANDGSGVESDGKAITVKKYVPPIFKWENGDTILNSAGNAVTGTNNFLTNTVTAATIAGTSITRLNGNFALDSSGNLSFPTTGRLLIGSKLTTDTITSGGTTYFDPAGELDLSKKFRVSITFNAASGSGNLRISINNTNSNGNVNAGLGNALVRNQQTPGTISNATITATWDPANLNTSNPSSGTWAVNYGTELKKSFIFLATDANYSGTISKIVIEYVD